MGKKNYLNKISESHTLSPYKIINKIDKVDNLNFPKSWNVYFHNSYYIVSKDEIFTGDVIIKYLYTGINKILGIRDSEYTLIYLCQKIDLGDDKVFDNINEIFENVGVDILCDVKSSLNLSQTKFLVDMIPSSSSKITNHLKDELFKSCDRSLKILRKMDMIGN